MPATALIGKTMESGATNSQPALKVSETKPTASFVVKRRFSLNGGPFSGRTRSESESMPNLNSACSFGPGRPLKSPASVGIPASSSRASDETDGDFRVCNRWLRHVHMLLLTVSEAEMNIENIRKQLAAREDLDVRGVFDRVDEDHDGRVSVDELL